MNKKIKVIDLIKKLNNFEFKRGTKIKFLNRMYLYDFPNLVGIYEIGKPTKRENSIFAQFDIINLNLEAEILEDNTEEIEKIKELKKVNGPEVFQNKTFYILENRDKINELVKAVNKLRKEKE